MTTRQEQTRVAGERAEAAVMSWMEINKHIEAANLELMHELGRYMELRKKAI